MSKKPNAQAFIAALGPATETEEAAPVRLAAAREPATATEVHTLPQAPRVPKGRANPVKTPRSALKHFGGYLDDDTLEKIALLRVRLKKDNSELIKLAIDDLHRKYSAKRAFGDA